MGAAPLFKLPCRGKRSLRGGLDGFVPVCAAAEHCDLEPFCTPGPDADFLVRGLLRRYPRRPEALSTPGLFSCGASTPSPPERPSGRHRSRWQHCAVVVLSTIILAMIGLVLAAGACTWGGVTLLIDAWGRRGAEPSAKPSGGHPVSGRVGDEAEQWLRDQTTF
jgi:hypothetical protein